MDSYNLSVVCKDLLIMTCIADMTADMSSKIKWCVHPISPDLEQCFVTKSLFIHMPKHPNSHFSPYTP